MRFSRFTVIILLSLYLNTSATNAQNPNALDASDGQPTQAVFVDAEGSVGVGTQTPQAEFHIFTEYGALIQQPFSIGGSNAYFEPGAPSLFVKRGSGTRGASLAIGNSVGRFYLYANQSVFRIYSPGQTEVLRLDESGWLGLGSSPPAARLDVGGAIAVSGQTVISPDGQFVGDTTNLSADPVGAAGGDLFGDYPNPEIRPEVVVHSLNSTQGDVSIVAGQGIDIATADATVIISTETVNATREFTVGDISSPVTGGGELCEGAQGVHYPSQWGASPDFLCLDVGDFFFLSFPVPGDYKHEGRFWMRVNFYIEQAGDLNFVGTFASGSETLDYLTMPVSGGIFTDFGQALEVLFQFNVNFFTLSKHEPVMFMLRRESGANLGRVLIHSAQLRYHSEID